MVEIGNGDLASIGERQWRMTFQGSMAARRVVVGLELGQLPFQVTSISRTGRGREILAGSS